MDARETKVPAATVETPSSAHRQVAWYLQIVLVVVQILSHALRLLRDFLAIWRGTFPSA
jgi:hypothetical protein